MARVGLKPRAKVFDLTKNQSVPETLVESRVVCDKNEKDLYVYYFLKQVTDMYTVKIQSPVSRTDLGEGLA